MHRPGGKKRPGGRPSHLLTGSTGVFALNLRPPEMVSSVQLQPKAPKEEKKKRRVRAVVPKNAFHMSMVAVRDEHEVLIPLCLTICTP